MSIHIKIKRIKNNKINIKNYQNQEMASLPRLYTSGRVEGPHPLAKEVNFEIYMDSQRASWIELPVVSGKKNWVE